MKEPMSQIVRHRYGRQLEDFEVGETIEHPWEVTVGDGMRALWQASFLDAMPLFASRLEAEACGLPDLPLPPTLLINLALSFSVHDVSERAIAHLAYVDVRFPEPAYVGDTVRARSTILGVRPASSGDRGVVEVRTLLENQRGRALCVFERRALIRGGRTSGRPSPRQAASPPVPALDTWPNLPSELRLVAPPPRPRPWPGRFEEFEVGQRFLHGVGHTVGESEHMQLTTLVRNTHPLHFDEVYCREGSFARTRVVYGGLVFAWVTALASRDLAGHALWILGDRDGAHPAGVVAGDTIYAASEVLAVEPRQGGGALTVKLVGLANLTPEQALARHGDALFVDELDKRERPAEKVKEKVFEVRRTLWLRRD